MMSGTPELLANFLSVEAKVLLLMKHFDSALGFDSLLPVVSESEILKSLTLTPMKTLKILANKLYERFLESIISPRGNCFLITLFSNYSILKVVRMHNSV